MKSAFFAACTLAFAGLAVASCGSDSAEPTEAAGDAAPDAPAGIAVSDGRLVLPAVKGNPGAVYFDIANTSGEDTAIVGVFVDGAKSAMLHSMVEMDGMASMKAMDEFPLAKGETLKFAPGGNHVMAMELSDVLEAGDTTDVTLTFKSGDKVSFPAEVLAAGDAH